MTAAPAESHGVVQLASLDVRRRPDHRAELTSQLLMGEVVRVMSTGRDGLWSRVRNEADGYAGWVRRYGFRPASRLRARRWIALARARVVVPFCQVRSAARGGHVLTPLTWNGRVIAGRSRGSLRRVELPDGRMGWAPAAAFSMRAGQVSLLDRIRELLGTPYLWGGRTSQGFDCSGFVQQLLAEQGVALPRDAHEQFVATRAGLEPDDLGAGDLVFFGRTARRMEHVGLVLGGGYYVHARGTVRVNSIDPHNPFCDKALSEQLRGFGRTKLHGNRRILWSPKYREPA